MSNHYLRKILIAFFIFFAFGAKSASAQYVTIPDTNFMYFLQSYFPFCMSGNQMDTTCFQVVNTTNMNCSGMSIADLTGIQYFVNLDTLMCANNPLTTLSSLPPSLIYLRCNQDQLTSLPPLPNTLRYLECSTNNISSLGPIPATVETLSVVQNNLTSLPTLPASMVYFDCRGNQLTSLPTLPPLLNYIDCGGNPITSLPAIPSSLRTLMCQSDLLTSLPNLNSLQSFNAQNNQITALPALPSTLVGIGVDGNQLTSLPTLPANLVTLWCEYNYLTSLPALPSTMASLMCDHNQITALPSLPSSLQYLTCAFNQLTSIPPVAPSLVRLWCNNNFLTSLPDVGDSLLDLYINDNPLSCLPELHVVDNFHWANTNIHCLPNICHIYNSTPSASALPYCQPSNGCPVFWNISGNVFLDVNGNCVQDAGDSSLTNIPVMLDSGSVHLQQVLTANYGFYAFRTGLGSYTVSIDTANLPFNIVCPGSFYNYSNLVPADSIDTLLNFGVQCKTGFDLEASSVSPDRSYRPGAYRTLFVHAGDAASLYNFHCTNAGGSVELILDNLLSYISSVGLPPTSVNGDTIRWTVADFSAVNALSDFDIRVQVSPSASIGDTICNTLSVYPTADNVPSNNFLYSCIPIINSFDPNEKLMYPSGPVDTATQWFTFTVFFQNTGSAAAEEIYLLDTLDNDLDASTFTYLNSSHDVVTQLLPGNILRFNYANINLPDSTANEPDSHGFVQYKVKRKAGLPVNTVISNTAYIYFDFNPPVVTNTVSAILSINLGMSQSPSASPEFEVYPNPTHRGFEVLGLRSEVGQLDIYNVVGEKVYSQKINSQLSTVNCQLQPGIYFVKVTTKDGVSVKRLVKN
jgi:hypothetical protein